MKHISIDIDKHLIDKSLFKQTDLVYLFESKRINPNRSIDKLQTKLLEPLLFVNVNNMEEITIKIGNGTKSFTLKSDDLKKYRLYHEEKYYGSVMIVPEELNGFIWGSDDIADPDLVLEIGGSIEDHYDKIQ